MKVTSAFFSTVLVLGLAFVCSLIFRHWLYSTTLQIVPQTLFMMSHVWLDYLFPLVTVAVCATSFLYKRTDHKWFLPLWVSMGLAMFLALFCEQVLFSNTSQNILDYFFPLRRYITFPSFHITLAASMVLPFLRGHKGYTLLWLAFLAGTAVAEIATFEHVFSDVIGGALIGLVTAKYILHLEDHYEGLTTVSTALHKDLEMRRQIAHALMGVVLVMFLYLGIFDTWTVGLLCLFGGSLSLLCKRFQVPVIYPILRFFERESHLKRFPGRGPLFFMFGSFIALLLFPKHIALASILILGIGDAFTNLLGRTFGKTPFFYNPDKKVEGPLYATILAGIGASFFAPILLSFTASLIALFVESLPLRIAGRSVDDNLTIPVVAGGVLMFLEHLLVVA